MRQNLKEHITLLINIIMLQLPYAWVLYKIDYQQYYLIYTMYKLNRSLFE